jgi:hypothetical protein
MAGFFLSFFFENKHDLFLVWIGVDQNRPNVLALTKKILNPSRTNLQHG